MNDKLLKRIDGLAEARATASLRGQILVTEEQIYEALLTARKAQDRIEEIVRGLIILRQEATVYLAEKTRDKDEAWAGAMSARPRYAVEEPAPRERYATYDLATISERMELFKAERAMGEVSAVLDYAQTCLRGVDGWRRDLNTLLYSRSRATALES